MTITRFLKVMFMCEVIFSHLIFSQERTKGTVFLLRAESTEAGNPHVHFLSAYTYQGSGDSTRSEMSEQETPLERSLSGNRFVGMFKDIPGERRIKVTLVLSTNGIWRAEVAGTGDCSVLYADTTGVGYGWPGSISDIASLRRWLDTRDPKSK